jgi:Root hair defective 3 GTP-binding protein (RHD3)
MLKEPTDENAGMIRYGQNTPRPSLTGCAQDFERKSTLFAFACSDILIVNLGEKQVGHFKGANLDLLTTVFEVNLGLYGKKCTDEYVPNHYFLYKLGFKTDLGVEQADQQCCYSSSFVTILKLPLFR